MRFIRQRFFLIRIVVGMLLLAGCSTQSASPRVSEEKKAAQENTVASEESPPAPSYEATSSTAANPESLPATTEGADETAKASDSKPSSEPQKSSEGDGQQPKESNSPQTAKSATTGTTMPKSAPASSPLPGTTAGRSGMSAKAALSKAQALKDTAAQMEKKSQPGAAYAKAAEAYSLVSGLESDPGCRNCKTELQSMLDRLASAANQKVGNDKASYKPSGKTVVIE